MPNLLLFRSIGAFQNPHITFSEDAYKLYAALLPKSITSRADRLNKDEENARAYRARAAGGI
jgi:hypothetical protein